MKSNQHLINLNLANCLFYLYYFILIGIAGLDNSTGEILTPFCLFIIKENQHYAGFLLLLFNFLLRILVILS